MKKQGKWQDLLRLMGNKGKIVAAGKLAAGAASITVLSVGGHHMLKQLQSGSTFRPELFANSQGLHGNQITFPENEEYTGNDQTPDSGENERLQRDRRAEEDMGKQKQDKASFEMDAEDPNAVSENIQNLLIEQDEQNLAAVPPFGLAGNAVLLTDGNDAGSANTVHTGGANGISAGNAIGSGNTGSSTSESGKGSGSSAGSDSAGGAGTGGGSGTAGGGSTDTPQPSNPDHPTPSPDPVTPVEPDHPSDSDKVYDPDYPDDSKQPELPKGPTWNGTDQVYPDFPPEGLSGKYSAELFVTDITETNEQSREYLYEGAVLTDWKLLCSALFYMNVYKDGEQVGRYRLVQYDDCFQVKTYPQYAERGLKVTFAFRPNTECDWQVQEVTFDNIKYAKYVVVNAGSSDDQTEELMSGYLDEGESASLSEATLKLFVTNPGWIDNADYASQTVTKIFPGWSLEPNGELLHGNAFTPQKGGRYILYPLDRIPVPHGCSVQVWHGRDEDLSEYYRQILTQFNTEKKEIAIPDGIHKVQCAFPDDMEALYIPESVQQFFTIPRVLKSYEVSEYSPYFYSKDDVLYDSTSREILGIPLEKAELDVPETVERVSIPFLNQLKKITFHSMTPPEMDVTMLDGTEISVPAGSYVNYIMAWGSSLPKNVVFKTVAGEDTDYKATDDGLFSRDGSVLRQASVSCYGLYIVPDHVKEIAPQAFEQSKHIDSVLIPDTVTKLDTHSLNAAGIRRIYLYGKDNKIPSICADTFSLFDDDLKEDPELNGDIENLENADIEDNTDMIEDINDDRDSYDGEITEDEPDGLRIWVPDGQRNNYIAAWTDILGYDMADSLIREGFSYQTSDGVTWLEASGDGATLLHVNTGIHSFDEMNRCAGEEKEWTRIGARAFGISFDINILEIPETVTEVGEEAFTRCRGLEVILFHTTDPLYIGDGAFENLKKLKMLTFNTEEIILTTGDTVVGRTCYVPQNCEMFYDQGKKPLLLYAGDVYVAAAGEKGYFIYGLLNEKESQQEQESQKNINFFGNKARVMIASDMNELEETDEIDEIEDEESTGDISEESETEEDILTLPYSILLGATSDISGEINSPTQEQEDDSERSYPLVEILSNALSDCNEGELTISEDVMRTIRYIGQQAFAYSSLSGTLAFSKVLKTIGADAFLECEQLEEISFKGKNAPILITYTPGLHYTFGFEKNENPVNIVAEYPEEYREVWKYYLLGYDPDSMWSNIRWDCYQEKCWDWPGDTMSMGFMMYLSDLTDYILELKLYPGDVRACELLGLPEPEKPALEEPDMDDYLAEDDSNSDWFAVSTPSNAVLADEILDEDEITEEDVADEDADEDDTDGRKDVGWLPSEIQNPYYIPTEDTVDDAGSDEKPENIGTGSTGSGGKGENNSAGGMDSDEKNEMDYGADTAGDNRADQSESGDDSTNGNEDAGSAGDAGSDADTGFTDDDSGVDAGKSENNESTAADTEA